MRPPGERRLMPRHHHPSRDSAPAADVRLALAASVPVGLRLGLGLGPGLPRLSDPSQWVHWQVLQVASESDSDDEDDS